MIDPAAEAFGDVATDYERARPSYPPAAIELLRRELGIGPGARVCDLAAGTGKLTRLLLGTGAAVVAVEPVAGMRHELRRAVPAVEVLDGNAEAIPLPDASVDAVTVAQAFHWFRFDEALAEIRRVLRPAGRRGGGLAILFNERDERTPWVAEWNRAIRWHQRRIAYYQRTDWSGVLERAGFADVGVEHIEWEQPMTRDLLALRVRSVSYVAEAPPDEQQAYVDRALALVSDFDEPFALPYITHLWWTRAPS
ncbi:MAG: methyltransferase domain-containing protein [Acidimicrobiales bacterium]